MSKEKSRCPFDDPNACFTCPFDDCKATLKDMNRQYAAQKSIMLKRRNEEIVDAFNKGATPEGLGDRYGLEAVTIIGILNKSGINVRSKNRKVRKKDVKNETY